MQSVVEANESTTIPPALLVSATYDGQQKTAVLKFYEPKSQKIFLWHDKTHHKPYCYSRLERSELEYLLDRDDILELQTIEKIDILKDSPVQMTKIIAADPLAIGGTQTSKSIRNSLEATWESDIKYYENYLYDRNLIVGRYYKIQNGNIEPFAFEIDDQVRLALKSLIWDKLTSFGTIDSKEFQDYISDWAELLNQPIPKIKRLTLDIEVESEVGRIPDPKVAEKKITAIGFEGSDGQKQVFVLKHEGVDEGHNTLPDGVKIKFYDESEEKEMLLDTFKIISEYPFVVTYNGDG